MQIFQSKPISCTGVTGTGSDPSLPQWGSHPVGGVSSLSPAAQFELFDDVADFLEPVDVPLLPALVVGDDLEGQEEAESHGW